MGLVALRWAAFQAQSTDEVHVSKLPPIAASGYYLLDVSIPKLSVAEKIAKAATTTLTTMIVSVGIGYLLVMQGDA